MAEDTWVACTISEDETVWVQLGLVRTMRRIEQGDERRTVITFDKEHQLAVEEDPIDIIEKAMGTG
jgi:hypothetical protein